MKYLFFLLSLSCTPFISSAGWGLELLGGTNMHVGPISRSMLDKGSKPGSTGILKIGSYVKKFEFGLGVEYGKWEYTNIESGYPLYHDYPPAGNPYAYRLNGNNYTSVYLYCNVRILNKARFFCSAGLSHGLQWADGSRLEQFYFTGENYVNRDGNIPSSRAVVLGGQVIAGYRLGGNISLKAELGARYGGYSFRHSHGYGSPAYGMFHLPLTFGIVVHNFRFE